MDINKALTREEREIAIAEKIKEIMELTHQDSENLGFVGCLVDGEDKTARVAIAGYGKNVIVALCNILTKEELKDYIQVALKLLSVNKVKESLSELLDELKLR